MKLFLLELIDLCCGLVIGLAVLLLAFVAMGLLTPHGGSFQP